jgi:multidrug efflux pump subunit AcrB
MGHFEYNIDIDMSPTKVAGFNSPPVKIVNGAPVRLGDVASVTDTHQPRPNVVGVNGKPATYLLIIRHEAASTLPVVGAVKARLPSVRIGMTDEYAENRAVLGRWQSPRLETNETPKRSCGC